MPEVVPAWSDGADLQRWLDLRPFWYPGKNLIKGAGKLLKGAGRVIRGIGREIGRFLSSAAGQTIIGGLCTVFGGPGAGAACAATARTAGGFINRLVSFDEAIGKSIGNPSSSGVPTRRYGRTTYAHLGQGFAAWPAGWTVDQAARAGYVQLWSPGMRSWTPLDRIRQQLSTLG